MRRAATLAILAVLGLTGCNDASDPGKVNDLCRDHGGVLSADAYGGVVVCGDRVAREF